MFTKKKKNNKKKVVQIYQYPKLIINMTKNLYNKKVNLRGSLENLKVCKKRIGLEKK